MGGFGENVRQCGHIQKEVAAKDEDAAGGAEPIAVISMALRVPGAVTPGQFWQNILDRTDSLTRPSIDELRRAGVSRRQLTDPLLVRSSPKDSRKGTAKSP